MRIVYARHLRGSYRGLVGQMVVSTSVQDSAVAISGVIQNYDWGVRGTTSMVARLHAANCGEAIKPATPYAELWIGTHPNGPARVRDANGQTTVTIKEHIGQDLPFLLKVLSVGKALSIQAHPDSELARKLHSERPDIYKDPNHKPEMAIALTPFEALLGFRPLDEMVKSLGQVPELAELVGDQAASRLKDASGKESAKEKGRENVKEALKGFFTALMNCSAEKVAKVSASMTARLSALGKRSELETLFLRLNSQYPNDIGCFCVFALNYVRLAPGEAIFLAANEPHAYLAGDCVECMATSDNVVRAGITPKFRDVATLCEMLSYKTLGKDELTVRPKRIEGRPRARLFAPAVKEFAVIESKLEAGQEEVVTGVRGPSILLCTSGDATLKFGDGTRRQFGLGKIMLVPASLQFSLCSNAEETICFQAFQP